METFGERLKKSLHEAGYSQVKATQELQLSKNAINNYVTKNRIPEATILYKLAKLIGVSMEWLLFGDPKEKYVSAFPEEQTIEDNFLSQDEVNIVTLYRQLSDQNKLKIQGMLEIKVSEEPAQKQKLSHSETNDSALLAWS